MFGTIGRQVRRYGRWILLVCALLTVPIAFMAFPQTVDPSIATLFPPSDPQFTRFNYFQENFGIGDTLVLVGHGSGPEFEAKMQSLGAWLKESSNFTATQRLPLPGGAPGVLIIAFPKRPAMDHAWQLRMFSDLREFLSSHEIVVDITGGSAVATESIEHVNQDLARPTILSLAAVVAILLLVIRDPIFPLFALIPLGMGIVWTLAFARWTCGSVNMLTATLPATLLGMGIDYAVYIRNCRREFPDGGATVWGDVFRRVGPPMVIGSLTTAAALFSMCSANLTGLVQIGAIGGVGILIIVALMFLMMPTLLDWRARVGLRVRLPSDAWLEWVATRVVRHRFGTLAIFGLLTVPLLWAALRLHFETNPKNYRDPTLPALKVARDLSQTAKMSMEPVFFAAPDNKAEKAVVTRLRRLTVASPRPFAFVDSLTVQMDLPGTQVQFSLYVGKDKRRLIMAYPREDPYESATVPLPALVETTEQAAAECGPDASAFSGVPLILYHLMLLAREDVKRTTLLTAAMVLVVLALLLRRWKAVIAAVVPLAGGMIWMLGVTEVAGLTFGLVSAVTMPLVLGMGIGYGVYVVHRLSYDSPERAIVIVGRAIIVSATTTACGFLALVVVRNPAVASMGLATGIGVISCLLWSLLFLPAFAAAIHPQRP